MNRVTRRELTPRARPPRDRRVVRKRPEPCIGRALEPRRLATGTHDQHAARASIPRAQSYLQVERG